MKISAAAFKSECLKLMDEVARTGEPIIITKHGRPVAQLAPLPAQPESLFGYLRNTVTITGDVVAPVNEPWDAVRDHGAVGGERSSSGRAPTAAVTRELAPRRGRPRPRPTRKK